MNLKAFIGKTVLLQFRSGEAWLAAHAPNGKPELLAMKRPVRMPDGTVGEEMGFIPSPFLLGEVQERDGNVVLRIQDAKGGGQLEVLVNVDCIACVTVAIEAPAVILVGLT